MGVNTVLNQTAPQPVDNDKQSGSSDGSGSLSNVNLQGTGPRLSVNGTEYGPLTLIWMGVLAADLMLLLILIQVM